MFPLKLENLHSFSTFAVLPNQLHAAIAYGDSTLLRNGGGLQTACAFVIRTLYLKYVERLASIIQRLKPLIYEDYMNTKLSSYRKSRPGRTGL